MHTYLFFLHTKFVESLFFCYLSIPWFWINLESTFNFLLYAKQLFFSHWVMLNSLQLPGLQHTRLLCRSLSHSLLKFMFIESVMLSNRLILWGPLLLLPSVFPNIRVFSNESGLHIRRSKYWSFSFSVSPSNEYSGLISFRIDWLDLFAAQRTCKYTYPL